MASNAGPAVGVGGVEAIAASTVTHAHPLAIGGLLDLGILSTRAASRRATYWIRSFAGAEWFRNRDTVDALSR